MKKNYYLATLFLFVAFYSCNGVNEPDMLGIGEVYPVSIQISDAKSEFTEKTTKNDVQESVKLVVLNYFIYNAKEELVKEGVFLNRETNVITEELPAGKYTVATMGWDKSQATLGFADKEGFNEVKLIYATGNLSKTQVFFKNIDIEVLDGPIELKDVLLPRISSHIEIIPEDASSLPDDLDGLLIRINNMASQSYYLKTGKTETEFDVAKLQVYGSASGSMLVRDDLKNLSADNPLIISILPLVSDATQSFPIEAVKVQKQDAETYKYVVLKTVKTEYSVETNQVLRLTGKLFDKPEDVGDIVGDNQWDKIKDDIFEN